MPANSLKIRCELSVSDGLAMSPASGALKGWQVKEAPPIPDNLTPHRKSLLALPNPKPGLQGRDKKEAAAHYARRPQPPTLDRGLGGGRQPLSQLPSYRRGVGQPPAKWSFFGPPPLIKGEDPAAYDELLARVSGAVKPADILEEIWVRDVVDLVWQAQRLRRLKADLITANAHRGLCQILMPLYGLRADVLSKAWARREAEAIEEVDKLLASAGLSMDAVMAQTLALKLEQVEKIDRMIMSAEARRNAVLREVDRHRASVAQALRQAANVEDAHFTEIAPKQIEEQKAA